MHRIFTIMLTLILSGCSGTRPDDVGQYNSQFVPCPDSPNCVSSEDDKDHFIKPFELSVPAAQAWQALQQALSDYPGAKLISVTEDHLYAEFTSLIFRYVDDVEFHLNTDNRTIAVRSASRLGHSDLGANRKRIEAIRKVLQENKVVN